MTNNNELSCITPEHIVLDRRIIAQFGSPDAALVLAALRSIESKISKEDDGWFPATYTQLKEITQMGTKRMRSSLNTMRDLGVIDTKVIGLPALTHYRINSEQLEDLVG